MVEPANLKIFGVGTFRYKIVLSWGAWGDIRLEQLGLKSVCLSIKVFLALSGSIFSRVGSNQYLAPNKKIYDTRCDLK